MIEFLMSIEFATAELADASIASASHHTRLFEHTKEVQPSVIGEARCYVVGAIREKLFPRLEGQLTMNRVALISTILAAFLCPGTLPAQTPSPSTQNTIERAAHAITPENILSIRDIRELQLSPDGKRMPL
jgi:hypothetical protein